MPQTDADFFLLTRFWTFVDKLRLTPHYRLLFEDSYDNCIGYWTSGWESCSTR